MKLKEMTEEKKSDVAFRIDNEGFWYSLSHGGFLKPEDILENSDDIKRVKDAINTLMELENICPSL